MNQICYRIAVVGDLPEEQYALRHKIAARLAEIRVRLSDCSAEENRYQACFIAPEEGLQGVWEVIRRENAVETISLPAPREHSADGGSIPGSTRRSLVQLSDLADLVLAFWNEDPDGEESYVWETLHRCTEKQVPCIWVSKKNGAEYWASNVLFEPFQSKYLIDHFRILCDSSGTPVSCPRWGTFLADLGNRCYTRMLKRYAVSGGEDGPADRIMEDSCVMADAKAEKARSSLLAQYRLYDSRAMRLSELYRGSIYWRSILPMVATILLAFAFYADAVYKALWHTEAVPQQIFRIISYAFFLHGIMILGSHLLAKSKVLQSWHRDFLSNRVIAEILRYYIHVLPYGITLPLNRILDRSGFAEHPQVHVKIWHLLHRAEAELPAYQEANAKDFLKSMEDYLLSQQGYHRRSAARFQKLKQRLHTWEHWMMVIGIAAIGLRGIAQFFIIGVNKDLIFFQSSFTLPSYCGSIANMFAMIIPAIAAYFSGKLSLFGIDRNIALDESMEKRLAKAVELVRSMTDRDINYSMIRNLTEQIGILVMGDVALWNQEMAKKEIKGL